MLQHIDNGRGEARELHMGANGWFAIIRKSASGRGRPSQRMYRLEDLDGVVDAIRSDPDVYLSQGAFALPRRRVSALASIGCAFVDIDCYKLDRPADDALVNSLLERARECGIPEPSYVTASGRGLYCRWLFERPVSAYQLTRWQALQSVLVPLFRALGADSKVRDAARVLRVMGSTNRTAGRSVHVVYNSGRRHEFDALCAAVEAVGATELLDEAREDVQRLIERVTKRVQRAHAFGDRPTKSDLGLIQQYEQQRTPVMLRRGTPDHLHWHRFVDLRRLCEMRGGVHRGSRDLTLFWMGTFLAQSRIIRSDNFRSELSELVTGFGGEDFRPLEDGSMGTLLERLKARERCEKVVFRGRAYDPLYTPTNQHLIEIFEISRDEQQGLATIISPSEKLRRADLGVPGRAQRRQERLEWRALADDLAEQARASGDAPSVTAIAAACGVDKSQVSRWLKRPAPPAPPARQDDPAGHQARQAAVEAQVVASTQPCVQQAGGDAPPGPAVASAIDATLIQDVSEPQVPRASDESPRQVDRALMWSVRAGVLDAGRAAGHRGPGGLAWARQAASGPPGGRSPSGSRPPTAGGERTSALRAGALDAGAAALAAHAAQAAQAAHAHAPPPSATQGKQAGGPHGDQLDREGLVDKLEQAGLGAHALEMARGLSAPQLRDMLGAISTSREQSQRLAGAREMSQQMEQAQVEQRVLRMHNMIESIRRRPREAGPVGEPREEGPHGRRS